MRVELGNKSVLTLAVLGASITMGGCGSSSSSSTPQAELTTERVSERVDTALENLADCTATSGRSVLSAIDTQKLQDVIDASKALSSANKTIEGTQTITFRPSADLGSCDGNPGTVDVTSEHGNGDTRYELVLDHYCSSGPEGDTVLTGTIISTEDGTPSDSGPVISAVDLSTSNLQVGYKDENGQDQMALVTIAGARTNYGVPSTWSAGTPTSENPDQTTVSSVVVNVETTGEVHQLNGLSMTRYGGNTASVEITSGTYITPTGDYVSLATEDNSPIVINVNTGEVTEGALVLTGSNESQAVISATQDSRVADISVNGESLDTQVDCSNADTAVKEILGTILSRLPIN